MGGSLANFHYEVFVGSSKRSAIHGILYGPSKNEWRDGDEKSYPAFMIHKWQPGQRRVRVKIWESDEFGPFNDVVLDTVVRRRDTMVPGMTWHGVKSDMELRPEWLDKLPDKVPRDRKIYVQFVTRTIKPINTYKWVYVGYGDIPHHDLPPSSHRVAGGPQPRRASASTLGLGAVCPFDDLSKCHYKSVTALQVIGGRGDHPGPVFECIGPTPGCTYKWILRGRGDIPRHDLGSGPVTRRDLPDPSRCHARTVGLGAVIPDDDPRTVHYKDVPVAQVLNGRGKHPGRVYECVCK